MRLLLDTHVPLAILDGKNFSVPPRIIETARNREVVALVSIASLGNSDQG